MMYRDLVVVDTNVLINVFFNGRYKHPLDAAILQLEEDGDIMFSFSSHTKNELYKICTRIVESRKIFECSPFFDELHAIVSRSYYIDVATPTNKVSSDKGDQYFIDLAVNVNAKYLITNDTRNGLLKLGQHKGVRIITPSDYIQIHTQRNKQVRNTTRR